MPIQLVIRRAGPRAWPLVGSTLISQRFVFSSFALVDAVDEPAVRQPAQASLPCQTGDDRCHSLTVQVTTLNGILPRVIAVGVSPAISQSPSLRRPLKHTESSEIASREDSSRVFSVGSHDPDIFVCSRAAGRERDQRTVRRDRLRIRVVPKQGRSASEDSYKPARYPLTLRRWFLADRDEVRAVRKPRVRIPHQHAFKIRRFPEGVRFSRSDKAGMKPNSISKEQIFAVRRQDCAFDKVLAGICGELPLNQFSRANRSQASPDPHDQRTARQNTS